MKVVTKSVNLVKLIDLKPGDTFRWDESIFMKMDADENEENVIMLLTGVKRIFCLEEFVEKINGKFVIEP